MNEEKERMRNEEKKSLGFEDCVDQRVSLNINPDTCHFEYKQIGIGCLLRQT